MKKIRVIIVDDSVTMQKVLLTILAHDQSIEVVGMAGDPYEARDLIKKLDPDVLLLDVEMPRMDGVTFLKNLMRLRPMPVVMVSSYTEEGKSITLEALASGATDCITKPTAEDMQNINHYANRLITLVKNAAEVNIHALKYMQGIPSKDDADRNLEEELVADTFVNNNIVAIGASTGGIEAIEKILIRLPRKFPGIVIVQHISKNFSSVFASRINRLSKICVIEAKDGQIIKPGYAYIAPTNAHLTVNRYKHDYVCKLEDTPPSQGHKPSVDILFNSLAKTSGPNVIALLLTGMGSDGAVGLKSISTAGGITVAQDQQSSVVWGMPSAAIKLDAAKYIFSIDEIIHYLKYKASFETYTIRSKQDK